MAGYRSLALAAVLVGGTLGATAVNAASLTTTFASNNGARGNMFDVTVTNPLTVTSVEVNLLSGLTKEIFVYYRSGSWVGFQGSSAGWTLAGSQTVTSSGSNVPTPVDVPDFSLPAGVTGFFVTTDGTTASAILYTNGTTTFSNADLSIAAGAGTFVPFDGAIVSDRIWNGTIFYELGTAVPEPASLALMAAGLLGLGVARRRSAKH